MKKKLFAILLSIVMVAVLLPTVAFATENYNLYVNGEQFTSEKLSIACGEGTASYDPNTKTLTLNNAAITNGGKSDESPKYGIRVVGDTDLTIKLSGTNSITLDNGGGIFADGSSDNYNIIGDGKLTINVKWDALYTLNGNISISEGAELDITSAQGCGITSYNKGILSIDGAKVAVSSYYTAASAKELEIKNNSEVVLIASADQFNAVYMGDENGAGKIEIINSKVEATSYYPALFTEGNLTVNGGEVKCTSTADGAIWTRGDILIKGGAKVTTYSEYPMGGNGSFTVEEAEIDAKNTNENNIPAIFDESVPVIADGYHLNYAKAVDSEGTEIDLLSSGTQYFALYKNVHFITKAVYPVSFVVTPDGLTNVVVKVNGQEVTGSVSLEAGTYPVEVTADNCKAYTGNITITADAETHTQTIAMTYLPSDYTMFIGAIAAFLKEVETSPFSDVSTSAYYYEAVKWAQEKGITGGIGNGLFGPNQPCTRAQIVTFLWRGAGSPVVNYAMNMSDVPEGSYYAEAVRWALSEGITTGTTENTFSPDSECTRAQAVAFLFRYAASEAVTLQELVSGFSDADSVPGYALPAMNWALAEEIVQGNGSKLMPNDSCTRAQIVTFLFRA